MFPAARKVEALIEAGVATQDCIAASEAAHGGPMNEPPDAGASGQPDAREGTSPSASGPTAVQGSEGQAAGGTAAVQQRYARKSQDGVAGTCDAVGEEHVREALLFEELSRLLS